MIFRLETTNFEDVHDSVGTHESDFIASFYLTGEEFYVDYNASV